METTRIIEAYLDGNLDPADRAALEARAAQDPEFADLIRLHKEVNESIRDEGGSKLCYMLKEINN
jgi:anti-sigma factor RsiW